MEHQTKPENDAQATATLRVLHERVSAARLGDPAPDSVSLDNICRAALRAADHGLLRPWRFLRISGDARLQLGELFARQTLRDAPDTPPEKLDNVRGKALRAPLLIVAISSPRPHPKVPFIEQELSTGAAVQNMLNAAFAQGIGAMWRTGPMASGSLVREGLGLEEQERIIGFLYLGQPRGAWREPPQLDVDDHFHDWEPPLKEG